MPLSIFRLRTLVGANIAGLILGTVLFSMFLMLTLYMQQVLGYSPLRTGFAYLAVAGTAIVWSAVAAQLVTRVGVKRVLVVGMAFLTAGLAYFTQVSSAARTSATCCPGSSSSRSAWGSRSCRSRSRRSRASSPPRRASPRA